MVNNFTLGPLEQFDVFTSATSATPHALSLPMPVVGIYAAVFLVLGCLWANFQVQLGSGYDFVTKSIYEFVQNIAEENLNVKKQRYFTVLIFLFSFIFFSNVGGLLPFSMATTSLLVVTLYLSLLHFIGVNLIGASRHRWELANLFYPGGCPLVLAPLLIAIEFISYVARVISLSVRLFANMLSGHTLLKILISAAFGALVAGPLSASFAPILWTVITAILALELLIAFLQSYVFTILVSIYLNDVLTFHGD